MTDIKKRTKTIIDYFDKEYSKANCSIDYTSPIELLVSTQLSAQCTDERVNIVAKDLYKKYRNVKDFAEADISDLENIIRPTGFFRNKARNVKACCMKILSDFNGSIPDNMDDMLKLPGVGRKTANLVLGIVYGRPGIVVDTHVKRISNKIGLTRNDNPDKIEIDLMQILPKENWLIFSHQMILHGRAICNARNPKCEICGIRKVCEYGQKNADG